MDKNLTIYNFAGNPVEIVIPNFEEVFSVRCEVISGDELLFITYNDGSTKCYDSCPSGRLQNYFDGNADIPLSRIDEISNFPDSMKMLENFGDTDATIRCGINALGDLAELITKKGESV